MTRLTRTPFLRAVALFGALLLPALPWAAPAPGADRRRHGGDRRRRRDGRRPPRRLGRAEARRDRLRPHVRDVRQGRGPLPGRPAGGRLHGARRPPGLRAGRAGAHAPDRPDGQGPGRPPREGDRRGGDRRRRGAARRRLQDRLVDEHRPRADQGAPGREPRVREARLHRAGRPARAGRVPLRHGRSGHRLGRQREPVDDPRRRRRLHRPGPRPRQDARLAGRHLRVPRRQLPVRRRGRRLGRRRPDGPHEDRDERLQGLPLRVLPGRGPAREGRPRAGLDASTSAAASTASRSAGRSSRTGPTSSSRASTSTRSGPRSSGPRAPSSSQAADLEVPTKQILAFGSVTHSLTDSQSLLFKADYERYRQENFRVGGVQDVAYGQELQRDNYNFTAGHTVGRRGRDDERAPRPVRPPEVLRADELRRRRRLVLERHHAQDRRQHPRRPPRRGRPVRDPRHALLPPHREERHARREGRRRLAAREGPLDHRHVRHGALPLGDRHEGLPDRLRLRRRLERRHGHDEPDRGASSRTTGGRCRT